MHRVLVVIIVEDVTRASGGFIAKEDGVREVARVQRCLAGELVHRGTGVSCILEAEACARVHWHVLRLGSHPFRRAAVRASAKLALTMFVVSRRPRPVVCALACLEVTHVVNNSGDALNVEPIVTRPAHSAASADARRGMVVVDIAVPHLGRGRQTKEDSKHFLDTWRGHLAWTRCPQLRKFAGSTHGRARGSDPSRAFGACRATWRRHALRCLARPRCRML